MVTLISTPIYLKTIIVNTNNFIILKELGTVFVLPYF